MCLQTCGCSDSFGSFKAKQKEFKFVQRHAILHGKMALLSFRLMNVHFIGLFAFIASGLFTYRFRSWLAKCEESAYWVAAVIMDVL